MLWWWRNKCHNLTWHVIGIVGTTFTRYGRFPKDVFSPIGYSFNWAYIDNGTWFKFPFISYKGRLGKFYFGWRERGNFGIKFTGILQAIAIIGLGLWMNIQNIL